MLKITEIKGNTIYYDCDCGTKGRCLIRPLGEGSTFVLDLSCASCSAIERMVLVQELNDDAAPSTNDNMAWSLILTNDVVY